MNNCSISKLHINRPFPLILDFMSSQNSNYTKSIFEIYFELTVFNSGKTSSSKNKSITIPENPSFITASLDKQFPFNTFYFNSLFNLKFI